MDRTNDYAPVNLLVVIPLLAVMLAGGVVLLVVIALTMGWIVAVIVLAVASVMATFGWLSKDD